MIANMGQSGNRILIIELTHHLADLKCLRGLKLVFESGSQPAVICGNMSEISLARLCPRWCKRKSRFYKFMTVSYLLILFSPVVARREWVGREGW